MSYCYIGRCPGCNQVIAVVAAGMPDYPAKEVAKDVAGFIKKGLIIERMDDEQVRAQFHRCTCPKKR